MQTKLITLQQLTDLIEQSTVTSTTNHAGMLSHTIQHETIGTAIVIQAIGDGGILIKQDINAPTIA